MNSRWQITAGTTCECCKKFWCALCDLSRACLQTQRGAKRCRGPGVSDRRRDIRWSAHFGLDLQIPHAARPPVAVWVDVDDLSFTQRGCSSAFRDGNTLDSAVKAFLDMDAATAAPWQTLEGIVRRNRVWILNNRRLACAKEAQRQRRLLDGNASVRIKCNRRMCNRGTVTPSGEEPGGTEAEKVRRPSREARKRAKTLMTLRSGSER